MMAAGNLRRVGKNKSDSIGNCLFRLVELDFEISWATDDHFLDNPLNDWMWIRQETAKLRWRSIVTNLKRLLSEFHDLLDPVSIEPVLLAGVGETLKCDLNPTASRGDTRFNLL